MTDRRPRHPRPTVAPSRTSTPRPGTQLDRVWAALATLRGIGPHARTAPAPEAKPRPRWAGRDAIRARPARKSEAPELPMI